MSAEKQHLKIVIHRAEREDTSRLRWISDRMRLVKDIDYFELNFDYQDKGSRDILIATYEEEDAGYCILNWDPKYPLFRKMGWPEIQDLNVLPGHRKRGIGSAMITYCEEEAVGRGCEVMGIGVGLDSSYGPAQKLYTGRGYIPDGNGVTYDRQPVTPGSFRPVDDQLCLMMVKNLKKEN